MADKKDMRKDIVSEELDPTPKVPITPRQVLAVVLVLLLVVNLILLALGKYSITVFWLLILAIFGVSWLFGFMKRKR